MFKAVILLTRRTEVTHEAFAAWWLVDHAPLAARLPGLRRGVFNVVDESHADGGPDGISELWFDTRSDFDAAYATELGRSVATDSMAHVSARVRLFVTEAVIAGPDRD